MKIINSKIFTKVISIITLSILSLSVHATVDVKSYACSKAHENAIKIIKSGDDYDKFIAIEALSSKGSVNMSPLFSAVNADTPFLARAAIASLLSINIPESSNKLFSLAQQDEVIADLVIESLQFYKNSSSESFIKWYIGKKPDHRRLVRALKAVAISKNKSLGLYVKENYKSFTNNTLVELYALYALKKLDIPFPTLTQKVLLLSNDSDMYIKEMSAVLLGDLSGNAANSRLQELSTDNEPRVSITALTSLIHNHSGEGSNELANILLSSQLPDSEIAAGSLKRLNNANAFKIINGIDLKKINPDIALRVIESTASLKGGDAKGLFKWALKQKNEDLIVQTIFAIGARQHKSEISLLNPFLLDKRPAVKSSASWATLVSGC
jgi:hypothetical protein